MDPHQNNMNLTGQQQQHMLNQAAQQYNPMLLQQHYMNNFQPFFQNQQMLIDPFQQQQYLVMQQQMQPVFQQPQQQVLSQNLLGQQTIPLQQPRFIQQPQEQQLSLQNRQQRLLEEQQRQMELCRQEQARQRQKELEEQQQEQRRQQELVIQREKEQQELLRQQEEAARLAEEQRRIEEQQRLEKEQLIRIRDEQLKKQRDSEQAQKDMHDRIKTIGSPISLVATHFMSDFRSLIPFPSESLVTSKMICVSDHAGLDELLENVDPSVVSIISNALSQVDINDIKTRLDAHEDIPESNDLPLDQMPPLIKAVMNHNPQAFDVEPEHDMADITDTVLQDAFDGNQGPPRVLVQQQPVESESSADVHSCMPSTSENDETVIEAGKEVPKVKIQLTTQDAAKIRKQMASLGKCPKATNQRRKRDMVESLYDSLTDYFDPSDGRRRRMRTKTLEDEQADQRDLELIARMEAGGDVRIPVEKFDEDGMSVHSDEESKFFEKKKKRRKEDRDDRPPTPTEVIHQREQEWNERQRQKLEKRKRRNREDEDNCWNNDVMAENDSFTRFVSLVDQVLYQVEDMNILCARETEEEDDDEINPELLIERSVLDDLRNEAQKLKSWKKLNKVPVDRLVNLITMLERNMRDVISQDNAMLLVPTLMDEDGEEDDAALRELVGDRLVRAADAACTALTIMTCAKMPKQVFIEDAIERAINICKHYLRDVIFPASDSTYRSGKKKEEGKRRRKAGQSSRSVLVDEIYARVVDLMNCFAELVRLQPLPETSIHHLATMSISSMFVSNVGILQQQAMALAVNIFHFNDDSLRLGMLHDILNSLYRLPPGKNTNNSYRLGPEQWISNTTVLILQLVQSAVKVPKRKKHDEPDTANEISPDTVVKDSFKEAQRLSGIFLSGFLSKCSCKGSKTDGEEDYRRIFDLFLQDLLIALYKPEWPAAELMLTLLGSLLVKHYRTKATDMTIRQASLDYLGSITARLRKDTRAAVEDSDKRMEIVIKTLIFEEQENDQYTNVDDVDISGLSTTDRLKKLEQALIDYLIEKKGEDAGILYTIQFYAGEWYKETAEDLDIAKHDFKAKRNQEMSEKERRKIEKRWERMSEKGAAMKEFLVKLVDRKHLRKRAETVKRLGNVLMDSDAAWAVKFLASRREFSHSFETYLRHILYGITVEPTVGLRTKAMRCLTQIIEADHEVLGMEDVHVAVNSRMMDPNAAVREATLELLGKFLLVKEEFIPQYYQILLERMKDSGTAVRKRVIRIIKEICEKYPDFEKTDDMLSKLLRRIVDEDGVKKLVQETFLSLWFQPISERGADQLFRKVFLMTSVAQICAAERTDEFLELLLQSLLKQGDKSVLLASRQIVDSLVDNVLALESKMAVDAGVVDNMSGEDLSGAQLQKKNQERLLASLTMLSIFSKVRPELMVKHAETLQPYLSMSATTPAEQQVLNEVICMLKRVVPLMSHPDDNFLTSVSGMTIVNSAVSCCSAVWHKFPRKKTAMASKFLFFFRNLNQLKMQFDHDPNFRIPPIRMPQIQRSVFTIGLMARYFDFDTILEDDSEAAKSLLAVSLPPNQTGADMPEVADEEKREKRQFRDNVFLLLEFFSRSSIQAIRQKSLTSIGHLCAQYAEYLARHEVKNIYMTVMKLSNNEYLPLKIQALKNLEMFLQNEEKKAIRSNDEWEKAKDQQNLKEMELAGSGLSSAVIQIYWNNVLNCYFDEDESVRHSAVQVAWLTLSQGLVTPGSSIPTLIAMTTDPNSGIRIKIENLLKEIDAKYAGMVQSKAIAGVRIAFTLNKLVCSTVGGVVRGIRACENSATANNSKAARDITGIPRMTNDGQAILSGLYTSLRVNRSQRRSFLTNILRLFSDDSREKLSLEEWIFVADNIAMFPYQVLDEPLYAIRQIDGIISLSGQSIVNQFKENLQASSNQPLEEDDVLFEPETLFRRFPDDKAALYELMLSSQACFILLYLKNFLIKLYGFTEAKVQEYSPSESAKVYEKALTRRNVHMFQPASALEELRPEVIEERNTLQGYYKLAHKICSFRKMLLSLDRLEEDEVDAIEEEETVGVTEQETDDVDDVDEGTAEESDSSHLMMEE